MTREPFVQANDYLVPDSGGIRQRAFAGVNVDVVLDAGVVRDDVMEFLGPLKRADEGVGGAFDHADHTGLRRSRRRGDASAERFRSRGALIDQAGHDGIAVHGGAGVCGCDEQIGASRDHRKEVRVAVGMDLQHAGYEVRNLRQNVAVLANPRDLPAFLQALERFPNLPPVIRWKPELAGEFDFIQRLIPRRAHYRKDARGKI